MGEAIVRLSEKFISAAERRKAPTAYDDAYPIRNEDELERAMQSFGRAPEDKRGTVKAHIRRQAKRLGLYAKYKDRIEKLGGG